MFCRQCGAEVKEGEKFCPKCGAPMELTGQGNVQNLQGSISATGEKAAQTNVATKKKKPIVIFIAIAVVFLAIIVIVAALGGEKDSNPSYADGLVEANNEFGLSTTLTLEEFVERYNEALVSEGLNHDIYWIDIDDGQLLDSTPGITEYQLKFPDYKFPESEMSKLQQHMNIGVDNETGYVVSVVFKYSASAYMAPSITDTETDVVGKRGFAVPIALFGLNAEEQLNRAAELMNSPQGYAWEKGILYIGAGDVGDGFVNVGFQTMTQEAYEERYQQ